MLSYQHGYHAGNAADVHKHALLAWLLEHLTRQAGPLSYLESHAGRGFYRLDAPEAVKTGEAAAGVKRLAARFAADHPYRRCLAAAQAAAGPAAYPGSPVIAGLLLRPDDRMVLAELHPREHAALVEVMAPFGAELYREDGLAMAARLCPPVPGRGVLVIDPSWEVKADYHQMPERIAAITRRWPAGVVMLWYPLLTGSAHLPMVARLTAHYPGALCHEVRFPPVRPGHRMVGSGVFVINPPAGMAAAAAEVAAVFRD